jgi:dihydrofolate synthase/folylpolyglutamate synthase
MHPGPNLRPDLKLGGGSAAMTYDEALAYLDSLIDFEKLGAVYFGRDRFQLAGTRRLLAELGDPQERLRITHIAGTKGKGSTAAMLDAILRAHGLHVGLFTKPHLVDIRERTRVDGRLISPAEFAAAVARVRPLVARINDTPGAEPITFYEAHLAASVLYFADSGVDLAIMETGLGGRLDATNALQPVVCAITRIDYDHTEIIGDRLEDIAREKAGILKPGVPCLFAPQAPEVMAILEAQAAAVGAPVLRCPRVAVGDDPATFSVLGCRTYDRLSLPLRGGHQRENAAVAIGLAEALGSAGADLTAEAVRAGLAGLHWPGRFQVVEGQPTLILDVAHNAVSARVLKQGLEEQLSPMPDRRLFLVVGMPRDKDIAAFADALFPLAARVICTQAHSPRAAAPEVLCGAARELGVAAVCLPTVAAGLAEARRLAGPQDVVCVTGSFHVVGEAMELLGIRTWEGPPRGQS